MTRSQEDAIELLALQHGRVQVDVGYRDGFARVIAPNGACWHVYENGALREQRPSFSVDWSI
jgi:hypothetical protein